MRKDLIIAANRLPVHRVRTSGGSAWRTSPGGLVSAVSPVLRSRKGVWLGWSGIAGPAPKPFEHEGIENRPIGLRRTDVRDFYEGMCNSTLWPLYHDAIQQSTFHRRWWKAYVAVNERFAAAADRVAAKNAVVWVHDLHLQLMPALLRARRPDLRIGFFLHVPFPPQELFSQLPWRTQLLEGMLGADVVGFQTRLGASNFRQLCRRFTAATSHRDRLFVDDRTVLAKAFPISIDVDYYEGIAARPEVEDKVERLRERLGGRGIILGVDRLDYTKGIDRRLRAFSELLAAGRIDPERWVFVQVGVPSRWRVAEYRKLRSRVERLIGEMNGTYGEIGRPVLSYISRSFDAEDLVALYRAAAVLTVTPLRDGMNLVSKEFVAARTDRRGALVLSEFSGAAHELRSALLVNPHNINAIGDAVVQAMNLDEAEQDQRMREMRKALKRNTVFDWSRSFLGALYR